MVENIIKGIMWVVVFILFGVFMIVVVFMVLFEVFGMLGKFYV